MITRPRHSEPTAFRYNRCHRSFALDVEPAELVELRRELVREVQFWLTEWEQGRADEAKGRLLQSLELLALVIRGSS